MGMLFVRWSAKLKIDHPEIDRQHRALFSRIEDFIHCIMKNQGHEEAQMLLSFLEKYTKEHFEYEEKYMLRKRYPKFRAHKQQHDEFVKYILTIKQASLMSPSRDISRELNEKFGDWLRNHILVSDTEITNWVKNNQDLHHTLSSGLKIERRL